MNSKNVMQRLWNKIWNSGFLKSVFTLSSGVILSQIITFIGMPVVSRVYTPAEMGEYQLIVSNASIISSVACLGMMTVFMLPEEDEESRGLCQLVTVSTVVLSLLAIVVLYIVSDFYKIFSVKEISYQASLLVLWLYIVFSTVNNIAYAYVNRCKLYKVMFWNPVIASSVNIVSGIGFGLLRWGFMGYTAAHILSYVLATTHLIFYANPYRKIQKSVNRGIVLLKRYSRFPVYQMPANMISTLSEQLPVQIIEVLFSSYEVGLYSMALRILSLPSSLLATPVNRVFFQEASARYSRGENIGELCYKILATNIRIAALPITALIIFGEPLFALFLGTQWREAGAYAAILGIYQMMLFCANCLSGHFVIIRKSHWNLISSVASLVLCVSTYLFFKIYVNVPIVVYLATLSILMTLKIIADQCVLFKFLEVDIKKYIVMIIRWVVLPCSVAFVISHLIW